MPLLLLSRLIIFLLRPLLVGWVMPPARPRPEGRAGRVGTHRRRGELRAGSRPATQQLPSLLQALLSREVPDPD